MRVERDPWLAKIFGCEAFRVDLVPDEPAVSLSPVFSAARTPRAFFYAKVPVTSVVQLGALTTAGFRVIDVNVTFEREPAPLAGVASSPTTIRDARPGEQETVLEIAATCFVYSRFHLDPQIPSATANVIKRAWIANYFRKQRGEQLLVAEVAGKPAGFLAVLVTGNTEKIGVIDLIGVDKAQQGQSVGRRLVEFFICDSYGKYNRLRVGTQIANVPSIRLYESCGFRVAEAAYVLHAHVRDGRVMS